MCQVNVKTYFYEQCFILLVIKRQLKTNFAKYMQGVFYVLISAGTRLSEIHCKAMVFMM